MQAARRQAHLQVKSILDCTALGESCSADPQREFGFLEFLLGVALGKILVVPVSRRVARRAVQKGIRSRLLPRLLLCWLEDLL